ncbi:hypothetical protein SAMN04490243_1523 [Robiginitalea myxolifaciens]|uniref:Tetratricopeptide repeat-containing protein n=1 Tax=Robiginitalea myxolifaciens TaxID=400055 RepID=A0A1I6GB98_9FLAO|nr:hypothetical protein [Robiginitalea myxolifaciens]SFR39448.1 hypothetical protein SAMN04490243_1523 [Robiginitalea myxolifaciens]
MNVNEFTSLLRNTQLSDAPRQTKELEEVLDAYPWFQSAQALYLKGLHQTGSYKYNLALKKTAAITADREILFDYITSEEFLQDEIADALTTQVPLAEIETVAETVDPGEMKAPALDEETEDGPLPQSTQDADKILDPRLFRSLDPEVDKQLDADRQKAREQLELGKPLTFNRRERYSFSEWLQLTTIDKGKQTSSQEEDQETSQKEQTQEAAHTPAATNEDTPQDEGAEAPAMASKFDRIDRFLSENPKITPVAPEEVPEVDIKSSLKIKQEELMTETLARVYLEQGKYKKAIQAYRILSLKYPEKSSFFADQISAITALRKDKNK